ncbi:prophage tail fiber N-terminal domain-containing protein, partial [Escherichia coli]
MWPLQICGVLTDGAGQPVENFPFQLEARRTSRTRVV